ncbi:hypothetical protein HDU96_007093 [Phlyctochytrium bullatum]|nr:hypothetical protein HDU96_007093 [Phlyctochytrium bullatum]
MTTSDKENDGISRGRHDSSSSHRRRRSVSLCSNESVDEFGRVKRRPRREAREEQRELAPAPRSSSPATPADAPLRDDRDRRDRYDDNPRRGRGGWERSVSRERMPVEPRSEGGRSRNPSRSPSPHQADGFYRKSIHVADLPYGVSHQALSNHFAPVGNVLGVKLFLNKPSRFAFITFSRSESAQRAIDELHGSQINGSTIRVTRARMPDDRRRSWNQGYYSEHDRRGYATPESGPVSRDGRQPYGAKTVETTDFADLLKEYAELAEKAKTSAV